MNPNIERYLANLSLYEKIELYDALLTGCEHSHDNMAVELEEVKKENQRAIEILEKALHHIDGTDGSEADVYDRDLESLAGAARDIMNTRGFR